MLVAATAWVYAPAVDGELIWDDKGIYITDNELMKLPDGIYRAWFTNDPPDYYPLTYTTFWLEYQAVGEQSRLYHLTNIALHLLTTGVLYLLLRRLHAPWPWLVCLLFAVHPIQLESVAWISQRKTLLGTLFGFAAAWEYLTARERGGEGRAPYVRAVIWFALSLAGKPVLITLPVLLAGYELFTAKTTYRAIAWRVAPFFMLSLVFGIVGVAYQQKLIAGLDVRGQDFASRLASLGWAAWFYVRQTFALSEMNFVYPRRQIDGATVEAWLPNIAAAAVWGLTWRFRVRWGLFPFAAWTTYLVSIAPSLGIADVFYWRYSYVGDHYVYQSLPAILILPVWLLSRAAALSELARRTVYAASASFACAACIYAHERSYVYQVEERVWVDALRQNPRAFLALSNLGGTRRLQGRQLEARQLLEEAVAIEPTFYEAWTCLGDVAFETEDWETAFESYGLAQRYAPEISDQRLHALIGRGQAAYKLSRFDEAEQLLRAGDTRLAELIAHHGSDLVCSLRCRTLVYLAALHARRNESAQQTALQAQAAELAITSTDASAELAGAYDEIGEHANAARFWKQALADPNTKPERTADAGLSALMGGDTQSAVELLQKAVAQNPSNATTQSNCGIALMTVGSHEPAVDHFREAVRLAPGDARKHANLALAYSILKRRDEAAAAYREVLRLEPSNLAATRDLAWLLATTSGAGSPAATEALNLAQISVRMTHDADPSALDALGAALAVNGRFAEAAAAADRADALAAQSGAAAEMRTAIQARAALYRQGAVYREP